LELTGRRLVDLSHPVEAGMTTYPGLPGPVISDFWSRESTKSRYAPGTTFQIGRIEMIANTGTYVDAPFHRFANGSDLAGLPLNRLADLPGVLVDATQAGRAVEAEIFRGRALGGRAVLVRTDWDRHWRTPQYAENHPYLTRGAAEMLVREGAALVGIDSLNIDDATDLARSVHTLLLEAGIPIVEHLTGLGALPSDGFRFHAVPAPVAGMGSFPVRAYAVL
jgi:kynurenine formamidase